MRFRRCRVCFDLLAPGRFIHSWCEAAVFQNATINGIRDDDVQRDAAKIAFGNTAFQARGLFYLYCKHGDLTFPEIQDLTGMEYSPLGPRNRFLRGYRQTKQGDLVINGGYTGPVLVLKIEGWKRRSTRTKANCQVYQIANL